MLLLRVIHGKVIERGFAQIVFFCGGATTAKWKVFASGIFVCFIKFQEPQTTLNNCLILMHIAFKLTVLSLMYIKDNSRISKRKQSLTLSPVCMYMKIKPNRVWLMKKFCGGGGGYGTRESNNERGRMMKYPPAHFFTVFQRIGKKDNVAGIPGHT